VTALPSTFDTTLRPILDDLEEGLAILSPQPGWRIVYANPAFAVMLQRDANLIGTYLAAVSGSAASALTDQLDQFLGADAVQQATELELPTNDDPARSIELHMHRLQLDGAPLIGVIVRGIGPEQAARSDSDRERIDPLTGLPDRSVLMARMAGLLGGERAADCQFAVLFIDLDNFKQVNDAHGHLVGDRVLGEVARRLADCVRTGDLVVRFGGDEFVALIERISTWEEIQPVVDRIHTALAEPISLPDGDATLSVSVGVAEASADHLTPEDLLRDADRAMYALKRSGRG
jgi:diguanylate cyclase (GGDEF)-like protein